MDALANFKYYNARAKTARATYGLYDIIADRFLIVLSNKNVAIHLKYILSSRYNLHICRLDAASNYAESLITNATCDNWSLSNREDIKFANTVSNHIIPVVELCTTREVPTYNVVKEKMWCLFCAHCLHIIENEREFARNQHFEELFWQYSKLDHYLNNFLEIKDVDYTGVPSIPESVKKEVLKLLYLGRDFEKTENAVKQLIHL